MCTLSMVMDHYQDRFPYPSSNPVPSKTITVTPLPTEELRQLIREFREAVAAAKTVDALTNQPDCEDPEKAKLEERVAVLEAELLKLKEGN